MPNVASVSSLERRIGRALPPDDSGWRLTAADQGVWVAEAAEALAAVSLSAVPLLDLPVV